MIDVETQITLLKFALFAFLVICLWELLVFSLVKLLKVITDIFRSRNERKN